MSDEINVDSALRRAALLFRVLAVVWMTVMVVITLIGDASANAWVVAGALMLALVGAVWSARHLLAGRELSPSFLVTDSLVALAVAVSPQIAGASDAFYGGYPMSTVVMVAVALDVGWALVAAGVFSATQLVALIMGAPSATSLSDWISLTVMAAVVALVVSLGAAFLRSAEMRRARAEETLEEERRRHAVEQARMAERVAVADDLHDSLLQTVRVVAQNADDPKRVRSLARRQERDLRSMIERMHGGSDGTAAALREAASDIEELHGVEVDIVAGSDVPLDDRTSELVRAAREAIVNAARHSGSDRIDVTLEVAGRTVGVVVRDRGKGFDPSSQVRGHGLDSLRERMERVDGRISLESTPGEGTEVELSIPRAAS